MLEPQLRIVFLCFADINQISKLSESIEKVAIYSSRWQEHACHEIIEESTSI